MTLGTHPVLLVFHKDLLATGRGWSPSAGALPSAPALSLTPVTQATLTMLSVLGCVKQWDAFGCTKSARMGMLWGPGSAGSLEKCRHDAAGPLCLVA